MSLTMNKLRYLFILSALISDLLSVSVFRACFLWFQHLQLKSRLNQPPYSSDIAWMEAEDVQLLITQVLQTSHVFTDDINTKQSNDHIEHPPKTLPVSIQFWKLVEGQCIDTCNRLKSVMFACV